MVAGDERDWVRALRPPPDPQAVADLRALLQKNLRQALLHRRNVNPSDIEDFAQEATMRVVDRYAAFRGDSRFTTWATSVAVRVALSRLRRGGWKDEPRGEKPEPVERAKVETELYDAQLRTALRKAIQEVLTERQRTVIEAELAGTRLDELAATLGSRRNALYKVAHDARSKLRAALVAAGFDLNEVKEHFQEASDE